jgi:hypothetical protein
MTQARKVEIIAGKIRVVCYGVLIGESPEVGRSGPSNGSAADDLDFVREVYENAGEPSNVGAARR